MPDGCTKFCYNGSYNMGTQSAEFYLKHQFRVPSNMVSVDTNLQVVCSSWDKKWPLSALVL